MLHSSCVAGGRVRCRGDRSATVASSRRGASGVGRGRGRCKGDAVQGGRKSIGCSCCCGSPVGRCQCACCSCSCARGRGICAPPPSSASSLIEWLRESPPLLVLILRFVAGEGHVIAPLPLPGPFPLFRAPPHCGPRSHCQSGARTRHRTPCPSLEAPPPRPCPGPGGSPNPIRAHPPRRTQKSPLPSSLLAWDDRLWSVLGSRERRD